MNNSSQPIIESQDGRRTTSSSVLRTAAYCVIFTLGLLGNAFVLVALKRKRRKTANDWFILNLTIADLLLIVCLTSDVYVELANSPYNTFFCKGMRPLSTVVFSASIFTMTTMALERHQVITKPFHPRMRQGRAQRVIAGIWVLAVVFTVPLPIVTTAGVDECKEPGWPAPFYSSIYTVILVVIQYLLPLVIITAAYIGIVFYLRKEKASQRALNIRGENAMKAARKGNMQAVKAVLTVVIFFAVCMLPNQLAWLLLDFGQATQQEIANQLVKFSPITLYLHSCANPIIYGTFMEYFRQEFKVWVITLLTKFSLWCGQIPCVWRRTQIAHNFANHSTRPAHAEPHETYQYIGDNFIMNTEARRERIANEVTKSRLGLAMTVQINLGFTAQDQQENQETKL